MSFAVHPMPISVFGPVVLREHGALSWIPDVPILGHQPLGVTASATSFAHSRDSIGRL